MVTKPLGLLVFAIYMASHALCTLCNSYTLLCLALNILGTFAKSQNLLMGSITFVCPSICPHFNFRSHWMEPCGILWQKLQLKSVDKIHILLKSNKNTRHFAWKPKFILYCWHWHVQVNKNMKQESLFFPWQHIKYYTEWFRMKGQYFGRWQYQSLWEKKFLCIHV
jgi:hypothetical protein